jgi:hypothetical protein
MPQKKNCNFKVGFRKRVEPCNAGSATGVLLVGCKCGEPSGMTRASGPGKGGEADTQERTVHSVRNKEAVTVTLH